MSIQFITEYPVWLFLATIIIAGAIAFFLYYRDKKLAEFALWKIRLLMALRFLSLLLIGLLLLGPLVQTTHKEKEKPIVLFAQDNTSSLLYSADSTAMRQDWPQRIARLKQELGNSYDFRLYTFGESFSRDTSLDFSGQQTDFSTLFAQINNNYAGKNLGAVIVASDGIYTQGSNPVYASAVADYPVYSVALGDTAPRPDAAITDIQVNKIAYLNNQFPVRIFASAKELKGRDVQVRISHKGKEVFSERLRPGSNNFSRGITTELEAKETGNQRYTVNITSFPEENNQVNNSRDFVIEVIDTKQKILMLSESPHPDVAAIKNALAQMRSYEFTFRRISQFNGQIEPYNLLILHQLPSQKHSLNTLLQEGQKRNIPRLFIGGPATDWQQLSDYAGAFQVTPGDENADQAYPGVNQGFNMFRVSDEMQEFLNIVPPLKAPFGSYSYQPPYEVLAFQKIQGIKTEKPLIAVAEAHNNHPKTGIVTGTGLWHWRMYDYVENQTHRNFDDFINKIVQFLALKAKKEHITVDHPPVFPENENLYFEVQVYNEIYEVVEDARVRMQISGNSQQYDFTLSPLQTNTGKMYVLNPGVFPKGKYNYTITADIGDRVYEQSGAFQVMPVKIETINTQANHRVLYQLASRRQGAMFYPDNLQSIKDSLQAQNQVKTLVHISKDLTEIMHWKWLAIILLLMLMAEWFIRRYEGAY